ncbi:MAG: glycosyltransferase [Candidatus Aureabacteria bacterium]|nr:glycosyltransferase [Candidatus Auribacterota bacterium]
MPESEQFPSVTIVVSVYNKAWIIDKCMQSLLEIDYPDRELLIIEQYSTDGSYEILKQYEDKARIVRWGGNYPVALNRALDEVKTPLLALTDADCTVDKNWLCELVRCFLTDPDAIAVAGFVGTGEGLPLLTTLVGIENEKRYEYWSRCISRAPTMNLLLETEAARRIRFDERLQVALETDFGYRLTKMGKMLYTPKAIVYHYNRTSWRAFFRQQVGYARGAFWVYLKHNTKLRGDHISTWSMIVQIPLMLLGMLSVILAAIKPYWFYAALVFFVSLLIIYARDTLRLPIKKKYYPMMMAIFIVRTAGWVVGGLRSFFFFLLRPFGTERKGEKW